MCRWAARARFPASWYPRRRRPAAPGAFVLLGAARAAPGSAEAAPSRAGRPAAVVARGAPAGRMAPLGYFPTRGAVPPDGGFYWAVDAGGGADYIRIVEVVAGQV